MSSQDQSPLPAPAPAWRRVGVGLAWVATISIGFGALISYQMRAGPAAAAAPDTWPAGTALAFDSGRYNLVMFAHPKCPCSAASLEELKVILTRSHGDISATICFFDPAGLPPDWAETSLVHAARATPGINVVADRNGALADKFGALTSGQTLLFDREGRRLFLGGITPARGHAGDNRGRGYVLALAKGEVCSPTQTSVFGCALHDSRGAGESTR